MSLDQLTYLLQFYWPYMAGLAVIGAVVGWVAARPKSPPKVRTKA